MGQVVRHRHSQVRRELIQEVEKRGDRQCREQKTTPCSVVQGTEADGHALPHASRCREASSVAEPRAVTGTSSSASRRAGAEGHDEKGGIGRWSRSYTMFADKVPKRTCL